MYKIPLDYKFSVLWEYIRKNHLPFVQKCWTGKSTEHSFYNFLGRLYPTEQVVPPVTGEGFLTGHRKDEIT